MRSTFIPVSRPSLKSSDSKEISKVVNSSFVAGGPEILKFEKTIANYCHRKYAVAVTNGTSALLIALRSLNLPPQSKILIPSFTIISVLNAVLENDYKPVFIDVEKNTWNISVDSLKSLLNQDIKAAIIVQTYSSAPPMSDIQRLLNNKKIILVEDAAEGFGGSENGRKFGSFGRISILSFYANKLITTGEGGMILTDDERLYKKILNYRNLYFDSERKYIHQEISGNYRLTNLQASLGLSQFKRMKSMYRHRQKLYDLYLRLLAEMEGKYIQFQSIPHNIQSSYWVFPILIKNFNENKLDKLMKKMLSLGIETRHFFYPLDHQPLLSSKSSTSDTSFNLWRSGLYLPLGNGITADEVIRSAQVFKESFFSLLT